jgi:2-hydroxychromene-2-carboxylate isomerase
VAKFFEFFFDYTSPTAWLAVPVALGAEDRSGAELRFRPMFLGGVMQGSGNRPPGAVPAKAKYLNRDLQRCARHIGIEVHMNPAFPINTLGVLRATTGMTDKEFVAWMAAPALHLPRGWAGEIRRRDQRGSAAV